MAIVSEKEPSLDDIMQALADKDATARGEAPAAAATVTPAPTTAPPEEYVTEPPEGEFVTEAPSTEEYVTTEAPEPDERDIMIRDLMGQVNNMGQIMRKHGLIEDGTKPAAPPVVIDAKKYQLTPDELDRVIDHPEILNDKLQQMATDFNAALANAPQQAQISEMVHSILWAKEKTEEFYSKNGDLATPTIKKIVQRTYQEKVQEAAAQGRTLDFERTLEQIGREVRRDLGLKNPNRVVKEQKRGKQDLRTTTKPNQAKGKVHPEGRSKPTLPGANAGKVARKGPQPKGNTQRAYIDEMLGV